MTNTLLQDMLVNTMIYWPPAGNSGYGDKTYGSPEEIKCRWTDVIELFVDPLGKEIRSNSKVYPDNTATLPQVGGMIIEALLSELSEVKDPNEVRLSDGRRPREIGKVGRSPTFDGDEDSRTVWI